jgi:hypothetical protein
VVSQTADSLKHNQHQKRFWIGLLLIPVFLLLSSGLLLFISQAAIQSGRTEAKRSHQAQKVLQKMLHLQSANKNISSPETTALSQSAQQLETLLGDIPERQKILTTLKVLPTHDLLWEVLGKENKLFEEAYRKSEFHLNFSRNLTISLILLDTLALATIAYMLVRLQRLNRVVTVCAWSKTIKHEDQWMSFEAYLKKQFDLSVSHGMSENIYEKFIRNTEEKNKT